MTPHQCSELRALAQKELGVVWHILYAPASQPPSAHALQDLTLQKRGTEWELNVKWKNIGAPNLDTLLEGLGVPQDAKVTPRADEDARYGGVKVEWSE